MTLNVDRRLAAAVESLLFASADPLSADLLADILDVTPEEIDDSVAQLTGEMADRGVHVINVAGGYQMCTNPDFASFVGKLLAPPPPRLSRAAMETLAIVAYRQPVTLPEIEAIRGVDAAGVMRTLSDRGMVDEVGRKETVGRPTLYGTTNAFLRHFGLPSLGDLPPLPDPADEDPATS